MPSARADFRTRPPHSHIHPLLLDNFHTVAICHRRLKEDFSIVFNINKSHHNHYKEIYRAIEEMTGYRV